jgi:hypothetical protein
MGGAAAGAEAVDWFPTAVPLDDEGDPPEFATAIMIISAEKPKIPVSTLWRAGQDLPRSDVCGGCGGR